MTFSLLRNAIWTFSFLGLLVGVSASRCDSKPSSQAVVSFPTQAEIGAEAMTRTIEMVALGARPSGSATLVRFRDLLENQIKAMGYDVHRDAFKAQTPIGEIEMVNLHALIPGSSREKELILVAHYETKRFLDFDFVGANDATSAVALLVTLIPQIEALRLPFDVRLLFVDGEEAILNWSEHDSLYGSGRYAAQISNTEKILAAICVDMVGDSDLSFIKNPTNHPEFESKFIEVLNQMGEGDRFENVAMSVQDDHTPFFERGIPTLHIMDFRYGGSSSPGPYWHTSMDTIDKISAESLGLTGQAILRLLHVLGKA